MGTFIPQQPEDGASAGGEAGVPILAVRNDTRASKTSNDGDFTMLAADAAGQAMVTLPANGVVDDPAPENVVMIGALGYISGNARRPVVDPNDFLMVSPTDEGGNPAVVPDGADTSGALLLVGGKDFDGNARYLRQSTDGSLAIAGFYADDAELRKIAVDGNGAIVTTPQIIDISSNFLATGTSSALFLAGGRFASLLVTGATTTWTVSVEASLDNSIFTPILSHTQADGAGVIVFLSTPKVGKFFRLHCSTFTGGGSIAAAATITP